MNKPYWNPLADQIATHCPDATELHLVFVRLHDYSVKHGRRTLAAYQSAGLAESDLRNAGFELGDIETIPGVHVWRKRTDLSKPARDWGHENLKSIQQAEGGHAE